VLTDVEIQAAIDIINAGCIMERTEKHNFVAEKFSDAITLRKAAHKNNKAYKSTATVVSSAAAADPVVHPSVVRASNPSAAQAQNPEALQQAQKPVDGVTQDRTGDEGTDEEMPEPSNNAEVGGAVQEPDTAEKKGGVEQVEGEDPPHTPKKDRPKRGPESSTSPSKPPSKQSKVTTNGSSPEKRSNNVTNKANSFKGSRSQTSTNK
jgi:hypothetical protein